MKRMLLVVAWCLCGVVAAVANEPDGAAWDRRTLWKTVRSYAKDDNYTKVDEQLSAAFKQYPQARTDAELVSMELEAQYQLMLAENKKVYLASKPDTAALFTRARQTVEYALLLDSLDQLPDEKGRVKPRYAKTIGERLRSQRPNVLSGGKYYYKKGDYASAWNHFHLWLSTRGSSYLPTPSVDSDSVQIARLATVSAFAAGSWEDALHYVAMAETDSSVRCGLMEMEARALGSLARKEEQLAVVGRGHDDYPGHNYFAVSLITHYDSTAQYAQALAVVARAMDAGGNRRQYAYLSGRIYESMCVLDSAALCYDAALQSDSLDADVQASAGKLALRRATELRESTPAAQTADVRPQLTAYYQKATYHLEQARQQAPARGELWREGLREAYFRLNRGQELRALEEGGTK